MKTKINFPKLFWIFFFQSLILFLVFAVSALSQDQLIVLFFAYIFYGNHEYIRDNISRI